MPASVARHVASSFRRGTALPWLLIGGCTVAALELLFATVFWTSAGASALSVPQSIAAWVIGPAAFAGGVASAALGAGLYAGLMSGVVALYAALARRHSVLLRRPVRCGALYGVLAYVAIFKLAAPLLAVSHADPDRLDWTLACVVAYMTLVGIPCALFARAAGAGRRRSR